VGQNYNWISATVNQLWEWILNPHFYYKPMEVHNPLLGGISLLSIILTGVFLTYLVLPKESHRDRILFMITSMTMGLGIAGTITTVLVVSGVLSRLSLILALLSLILILGGLAYSRGFRIRKMDFKRVGIRDIKQHTTEFIIILILGFFVFFSHYHALLYPVLEWDALIYHAEAARLIYENMGMPLIAGPSIGIEMSANYPPLFSAIGAFLYILIDNFDDFYLRLIPPIAGLLVILSVYKLGSLIGDRRYGLFSALVLVMFQWFIKCSVYCTYYILLTLFIILSILFIILALVKGDNRYLIPSSILVAFSLLTSYLALYYLAFFILCLVGMVYLKRIRLRDVLFILIIISLLGGIWYVRNFLLLGNPVYPIGHEIFKSRNIDSELLYYTIIKLKRDSGFLHCDDYFCRLGSSLAYIIIDWHLCAPLFLLFLLGSFLVVMERKYAHLVIALWPLLFIVLLPAFDWFWMRYFILILPSISIIVPGTLFKLVSIPTALIRIKPEIKMIILISMLLLPSIVFAIIGPKEFSCSSEKGSCIYNLIHPGFEDKILKREYKESYECWEWVNEHLHEDEMVATFDPGIYYMEYDRNVFPLDGWAARDLYEIEDPGYMQVYLNQRNIRYIMIRGWIQNGSFAYPGYFILPLSGHLNSTRFPVIFHSSEEYCTIYGVGRV